MPLRIAIMLVTIISMNSLLHADRALPVLEEKVTYTNKGTRSEARHYYLLCDEISIPDVFRLVHQEGRSYRFQQRKNNWGDDGYVPVTDEFRIKESDKPITEKDIKCKWYAGKLRMQRTPWHWVYVEWEGGEAFVDPVAINKMAGELKLPVIPRRIVDEIMKMD